MGVLFKDGRGELRTRVHCGRGEGGGVRGVPAREETLVGRFGWDEDGSVFCRFGEGEGKGGTYRKRRFVTRVGCGRLKMGVRGN